MERPTRLLVAAAIALAAALPTRARALDSPPTRFGDGLCAITEGTCGTPPMIAILSAFPAELQPLVERATVRETLRPTPGSRRTARRIRPTEICLRSRARSPPPG